jgi:hypothetical protein
MAEGPEGDRPQGDSEPMPETIGFDYIKSNFFRMMFADGFIVGGTPTGLVHVEIFNQRGAIPRRVVHWIAQDGTLGEEDRKQREVRDAIIREVEGGIIMQVEIAERFIDSLQKAVVQVKENLGRHDK